jgi:peptidoglycan/LPS O-acetylase OafA/YrhL
VTTTAPRDAGGPTDEPPGPVAETSTAATAPAAAAAPGRSIKGSKLLADVASSRVNNFDSLRLIAALLVMVDHTFPIQGQPHVFVDHIGFTLGALAVSAFFAMSGFLVTKSWLDDPNPLSFTAKRALRLMPGLIVAVLFCAFVIGAMATTFAFGDYVRDPGVLSFIKHNIAVFPLRYALPGVFADNPYPYAVNGSLWSLPVEVLAYGVVLGLGMTTLLRRRAVVACVLGFCLYVHWHIESNGWLGSGIWYEMPVVQIWDLLSIFLIGALLYLYREHVVLSGRVALGLVALYIVTLNTPYTGIVFYAMVPYCLFTLAYANLPWLKALARPGDVSYGVYIYAFPVQQLLASHRPNMNPWLALVFTIPVTYVLALLSWRLVEKPALRLKRFVRRRAPAT